MTLPECRDGQDRGQLFSVSRDGTQTLFGGVGTSNGIDFSPDGRTMCRSLNFVLADWKTTLTRISAA